MNRRLTLVLVLLGLVFLGVLIYTSLAGRANRVEVCMEFRGNTSCRTASGATQQEALRTAVQNACALISSGVTDTIACERQQPVSVKWLDQQSRDQRER